MEPPIPREIAGTCCASLLKKNLISYPTSESASVLSFNLNLLCFLICPPTTLTPRRGLFTIRSLPDIRHPGCRSRQYLAALPSVSVVVPFHNEHWSTLLRTAYSVLYRSPEHLIKEVFLVDDASTKGT